MITQQVRQTHSVLGADIPGLSTLTLSFSVSTTTKQTNEQTNSAFPHLPAISQGREFCPVCCLSWLVFVSVTRTRVIWEEGTSVEKMSPSDWPGLWTSLRDIFLIDE